MTSYIVIISDLNTVQPRGGGNVREPVADQLVSFYLFHDIFSMLHDKIVTLLPSKSVLVVHLDPQFRPAL